MKSLVSKSTGFLATFLMLLVAPSGVALANQGASSDAVAGEAIIKYLGTGEPSAKDLGVLSVTKVGNENYLVQLDPFLSQGSELARLESRKDIDYAEPNYLVELTSANDPSYADGSLWGMGGASSTPTSSYGANAAGAWAKGYTGSKQVYVAVIDSGIDVSHPDLAGNMWVNSGEVAGDGIDNDGNGYIDDVNGFDFLNGDGSVFDVGEHPHGTHVAGTIGAVGNNGAGVAGVMWNVNLISAKTINSAGSADLASTIRAIDYITDLRTKKGLDIIASNNSWGGTRYSQALENAIKRGGDAGIMFVAAAGNDAGNIDSTPQYPAAYDCSTTHRIFDCVVSVAAIQQDGNLAGYSNFSSTKVDIAAPGTNVYSTLPSNSYGLLSGTSMAAPHVTGALALCVASYRGTSGLSAIQKLMSTATANAALSGKVASGGQLNVEALVDSCVGSSTAFTGALTEGQATAEYTERARLDWVDSAAGDYEQEIQVAVGPNGCSGTFAHLAYIGPGLDSFPIHDLEEAQFYCFRVRAIKDAEVSAWATSNVTITWTSNLPFISGKVFLADGVTPVANAPVRWIAEGATPGLDDRNALLAYTSASGEYVLQVSNGTPGELFVSMSRRGNTRMTTPVIPWGLRAGGDLTITQDTQVNIILPRFHKVTFTLVDEDTNQPIAGALTQYAALADNCRRDSYTSFTGALESSCQAWPTGYSHTPAKTDANGQVTLGFLDPSLISQTSHQISFIHPTNPSRVANATVVANSDQSVRVVMSGSIDLTGTVFLNDGVTPVANATVKWLPAGTPKSGENTRALSTTTNASGQYALRVTAGVGGELSLHTSRTPSTTPKPSPQLPHGVWAWGAIAPFTQSKVVNLVAPAQDMVTLQVVDQRGLPLAGAKVTFADLAVYCRNMPAVFVGATSPGCQFWPTGFSHAAPRTDSAGQLKLALWRTAQLSNSNYRFSITHPSNAALSATLNIAPTADLTQVVTISDEVSVSGQVLTHDGTPVQNITVKWLPSGTPESMGNESIPGVKTDANGRYLMKVSAGSTGQLFAWTTRVPSTAQQTSPLTPWGLHAGGTLTVAGDTVKDITLPRSYNLNFQVREFGSSNPVTGAKFNYSNLADYCRSGSYTAFAGASESRCQFWPVGYSHAGVATDSSGNATIPVLDRSYFSNKADYVFSITHPIDNARVATSRNTQTQTSVVTVEMPGTPSKPEQPDATPLTNEVKLKWNEPWNGGAFIDYYKVWVSLSAGGPFTLVSSGSCAGNIAPELRECVVTGLTAGVTYYFAIIAHNVVGYSDRSLSIAATPLAAISTMTSSPTPSVSGVSEVGRALTATAGVWDAGVALSYQWLRNSSPIQGAIRNTYLLSPRDAGAQISVEVTGRKLGFTSVTRTSLGVAASWPDSVQLVAIQGAGSPGQLLTVQTSELIADESVNYQWERDGQAISGATQAYYEVSSADVGSRLGVKVVSSLLANLPSDSTTDVIEIAATAADAAATRTVRALSSFSATVSPKAAVPSKSATASPAIGKLFVQKTLASFGARSTALSAAQKNAIRALVLSESTTSKFICTGIRREAGTRAENIMVRLRAKASCDFAKELNPELSTWYQSKSTKAPSYVGRVLLVARGVKASD